MEEVKITDVKIFIFKIKQANCYNLMDNLFLL